MLSLRRLSLLITTSAFAAGGDACAETLRYTAAPVAVTEDGSGPYQQRRSELHERKWVNRKIREGGTPPPMPPEQSMRAAARPLSVQVPALPKEEFTTQTAPLPVRVLDVQLGNNAPKPPPSETTHSVHAPAVAELPPLPPLPAPASKEWEPPVSRSSAAAATVVPEEKPGYFSSVVAPVKWLAGQAASAGEAIANAADSALSSLISSPPPPRHADMFAHRRLPAGAWQSMAENPLPTAESTLAAAPALPGEAEVSTINPIEQTAQNNVAAPQDIISSPDPVYVVKRASADGGFTTEITSQAPDAIANLSPAAGEDGTASPLPRPIFAAPAVTPQDPTAIADAVLAGAPAKPTAVLPKLPALPASETAEPAPQPTEPAPVLSPASRKILKSLPKAMGNATPIDQPGKIGISRQTQVEDVLSGSKEAADSHEAMGIKIDVRKPIYDANYELEKAYSALISGQSAAAIAVYESILGNDANNAQALFGLATAYHRAGQLEKARPLYGKVLQLEPKHEGALNNFLMLLAEESPDEALTQLQILQENSPSLSTIPAQIAIIYQKKADFASASDAMLRAVTLSPENITYRYNLAILFDRMGKAADALSLYQHLIEAQMKGEIIPNSKQVQERLTFLRSNVH